MVFGPFVEVGDPEIIARQLVKEPAPIRLLLRPGPQGSCG